MTTQLPPDSPPTGADADPVESQPKGAEGQVTDERATDNKNQRRGVRGPRAMRRARTQDRGPDAGAEGNAPQTQREQRPNKPQGQRGQPGRHNPQGQQSQPGGQYSNNQQRHQNGQRGPNDRHQQGRHKSSQAGPRPPQRGRALGDPDAAFSFVTSETLINSPRLKIRRSVRITTNRCDVI